MPQQGGTGTPQPMRAESPKPSAAREALQSNLDSTLTLNRKKSWFGSAREAFHRGARGVVGHWRAGDRKGGGQGDDQENIEPDEPPIGEESTSESTSTESHGSVTPLRPTRADRQKAFTPKSAMTSLRQHIHASEKDRGKRGALSDITGNGNNASRSPEAASAGKEMTTTRPDGGPRSPTKQHGRRSSIARSMIGSLRGLSRRGTTSDPTSPTGDCDSPTKRAAMIPLPSSPVQIPPPTLRLNLGSSTDLSTGLLNSGTTLDSQSELLSMTKPMPQGSMRLPTYYTRLPGEDPTDAILVARGTRKPTALTANELLRLPTDDFGLSSPNVPTTPVSGINAQLDLDGINEIFEEPPLFERSVEARDTPEKRDNKTLRKMISLDALAEQHIKESPRRGIRLTPSPVSRERNFSATTAQTCPTGMPPLTRQFVTVPDASSGQHDTTSNEWKGEDPFAPDTANRGSEGHASTMDENLRCQSYTPSTATPEEDGSSRQNVSEEQSMRHNEAVSSTSSGLPIADTIRPDNETEVVTNQSTPGTGPVNLPHSNSPVSDLRIDVDATRSPMFQASSRLSSVQYDQFHAEHFLGLEECTRGDPPPSMVDPDEKDAIGHEDDSENEQPIAAPLYQRIAMAQTSSPARACVGFGNSTDLGQVFWKFSMQEWMHDGAGARPASRPLSSCQDLAALSTDFTSRPGATPPLRALAAGPIHLPGMGDRLTFDLQRSNRNMRYNALTEMSNESLVEDRNNSMKPTSALPPATRTSPVRPAEEADMNSETDHSSPAFENVFPPSLNSSPLAKRHGHIVDYDASSDSLESGLQEAITDHYVFQNALAGVDLTETMGSSPVALDTVDAKSEKLDPGLSSLEAVAEAKSSAMRATNDTSCPSSPLSSAPSFVATEREQGRCAQGHAEEDYTDENGSGDAGPRQSDDDSLDDYLHLYKSYEACHGRFPGEPPSDIAPFPSGSPSPVADDHDMQSGTSVSAQELNEYQKTPISKMVSEASQNAGVEMGNGVMQERY